MPSMTAALMYKGFPVPSFPTEQNPIEATVRQALPNARMHVKASQAMQVKRDD